MYVYKYEMLLLFCNIYLRQTQMNSLKQSQKQKNNFNGEVLNYLTEM